MPSSRSASPISPSSERGRRAGEPRLAHPALALAFKLALTPLLVTQALRARRRAPVLPEAAGRRDGRAGRGDGAAAAAPRRRRFVGRRRRRRPSGPGGGRPPGPHARRRIAPGPIEWRLCARTGLTTRAVHELLRAAPPPPADVAVVVTGVNDVVEQIPVRRALAHRAALADWLLGEGLARPRRLRARCRRCTSSRSCRSRCAASSAPMRAATTRRWRAGRRRAATSRWRRSRSR